MTFRDCVESGKFSNDDLDTLAEWFTWRGEPPTISDLGAWSRQRKGDVAELENALRDFRAYRRR